MVRSTSRCRPRRLSARGAPLSVQKTSGVGGLTGRQPRQPRHRACRSMTVVRCEPVLEMRTVRCPRSGRRQPTPGGPPRRCASRCSTAAPPARRAAHLPRRGVASAASAFSTGSTSPPRRGLGQVGGLGAADAGRALTWPGGSVAHPSSVAPQRPADLAGGVAAQSTGQLVTRGTAHSQRQLRVEPRQPPAVLPQGGRRQALGLPLQLHQRQAREGRPGRSPRCSLAQSRQLLLVLRRDFGLSMSVSGLPMKLEKLQLIAGFSVRDPACLRGWCPRPLDDGGRDRTGLQPEELGGRTRTPNDWTRTSCVTDYTTPERGGRTL